MRTHADEQIAYDMLYGDRVLYNRRPPSGTAKAHQQVLSRFSLPWYTLGMRLYFPLERSGLDAQGRHRDAHIPGTIVVIDDEPSVVRALTGLLAPG